MSTFFVIASIVVLATIAAGFVRVLRGPHKADRMVAAQLFGTAGVAWILLVSYATGNPRLSDIALVFALLAAITAIAFVRRAWTTEQSDDRKPD
jgi:multicomponent Na+:H+ antiporter subunit F